MLDYESLFSLVYSSLFLPEIFKLNKNYFHSPIILILKISNVSFDKILHGFDKQKKKILKSPFFLPWMQPDSPCRLSSTLPLSLSPLDT